MEDYIKSFFEGMELGEVVTSGNLGMIPILADQAKGPKYLVLKEAQDNGVIRITEVDTCGSVPELKVINDGEMPVLLLDGEELIGAKQNRVLNTTILLRAKSETVIPVSCTEHGRWSYRSQEFMNSDAFAPTQLRSSKLRHVTSSLNAKRGFKSDQSAIWSQIDHMNRSVGSVSETGAMRQMYDDRSQDLDQHLEKLKLVPGQHGLVFFAGGNVVGMDYISLETAYAQLHSKLVRSYVMDAMLQRTDKPECTSREGAQRFVEKAIACHESRHESIGHGYDYRYEGDACVGSALAYRKVVVHGAFFAVGKSDRVDPMAGFSRRRRFRL